MPDMEQTKAALERLAENGMKVHALLQHPGMELLRTELEKEAGKDYRKWALEQDPDKREQFRIRAQGYELFFSHAKAFVLQGEAAKKQLATLRSANDNGV